MIKLPANFYKEIVNKFPFILTIKQRALFRLLSDFIFDEDKSTVFILKGYAGTGKTTTISTLVNSLWKDNTNPELYVNVSFLMMS